VSSSWSTFIQILVGFIIRMLVESCAGQKSRKQTDACFRTSLLNFKQIIWSCFNLNIFYLAPLFPTTSCISVNLSAFSSLFMYFSLALFIFLATLPKLCSVDAPSNDSLDSFVQKISTVRYAICITTHRPGP